MALPARIPKPANMDAFLKEVRDWARGPYAHALSMGHELPEAERQAVAAKLASYTGLSPAYLLNADLRVDPNRFRRELLRDQRRTLGRYDSRFTGIESDAVGESQSYDPSDTGITGAFVATFHDYISKDLGFDSELSYRPTFYGGGPQWDFKHRAPGARGPGGGTNNADVALDLGAAMRQNPNLKVYSLNGVYDMATPFFGTEYDLSHMGLDRWSIPRTRNPITAPECAVRLLSVGTHGLSERRGTEINEGRPRQILRRRHPLAGRRTAHCNGEAFAT